MESENGDLNAFLTGPSCARCFHVAQHRSSSQGGASRVCEADYQASQIQWRVNQGNSEADTEEWRRHGGLENHRRSGARGMVVCADPNGGVIGNQ